MTSDPASFRLFLKTHEIEQVTQVLRQVRSLSPAKRSVWLEENGDFLQDAFDSFLDESNMALDGASFDDESFELTQQLVVSLRDAMTIVEDMLSEGSSLQG